MAAFLLLCSGAFTLCGWANQIQPVTSFPGTTQVGQPSAAMTVPIQLTSTAQTYTVTAVTQGVPNLDFSITAETCTADEPAPPAGTVCTATVVFTPKYPGLRMGAVLVTSSDGSTLLGSTLIAGVGTGSLAVLDPGVINTVAGDSEWSYAGDGGPATGSPLYLPYGVTVDPQGQIVLSDTLNARVRAVATNGTIRTIAGDGSFGYSGDGGAATDAEVNQPAGVALDGAGNVYFADSGNDVIRRVDAVSGVITTVAGSPNNPGFSGDGNAATSAQLSAPEGIAFDAAGDLLIADTGNGAIRSVSATSGAISTIAGAPPTEGYNGEGTATAKMLNLPWAIAVDPSGTLYIADTGNNRIRRVQGGTISTVAGSGTAGFGGDGGPAAQAVLSQPYGVALDPAGNLYIADSGNDRVRKVSAGTGSIAGGTATIATVIGTGSDGVYGDGGPANQAALHGPYALFFAQDGNFFLADTHNDRIREVTATPFPLSQFPDTKATKVSAAVQMENVDSDGNAALNLSAPALVNAALNSGSTTCSFSTATAAGTACTVGVQFAPSVAQQNLQGSVTLASDAANTPAVIALWGNGLNVNPTQMAVVSAANPSVVNQAVSFTATVTNNGAGALSGAVTFSAGGSSLCNAVTLSGGSAVCYTSFSTVGQQTVTATYGGDANNESNSATVVQTVKQQASIALSAAPSETTVTDNVTLTARVTPPSGNATGTVTFYDAATAISGAVTLSGGSASFSTTTLEPGQHTLLAQYSGDAANAAGASNQASEVIDQFATTTSLSASATNPTVGQPVTLTVNVSNGQSATPTGMVMFTDNGVVMSSSATLNNAGAGSVVLSGLTPGTHSIVATYQGDTNDAKSSNSTAVWISVSQIGTVTALTADANPLSAGATLHLTATVSIANGAAADGALTGQVTFTDGGTPLNTVAIDSNGIATLSVSSLSVGAHSIVASYAGATNYAASTSQSLAEQVQQTPTTVSLATSASTAFAGKAVSFTATVTSTTGVPTGNITFRDGGTTLTTTPVNAQGTATFSVSTLGVGTHNITASYVGDANYAASGSAAMAETITLAQPTITLSGPADAADLGSAVTLTGTIASGGVVPSGTLTVMNGASAIASQTAAANGQFRFSTSSLPLGSNSLSVVYSGDSNNATATSPNITVTVQLAPTATALSTSANPGTVGQAVILTASVVSNSAGASGNVRFLDGSNVLGTASLGSSGSASLTLPSLPFGVHSLTASYGGDALHAASTSAVLSERMTQPVTATLTSSANPAIAGSAVTLTATIVATGGQIPTGTVQFNDGATLLGSVSLNTAGSAALQTSSLSVGQHAITVSYAGDANVAASSATLNQVIVGATTQVNLSTSTSMLTYGSPLTLTATVASNGLPPGGAVAFRDGGATIGSAIPNASGVATLIVRTLAPGTHSLSASYTGDAVTSASASAAVDVVVKQATSVGLSSSANPTLTLNSITLTATVANSGLGAATGTVVFSDGAAQLGGETLNASGVATLTLPALSAGNHAITASYAGDDENLGSNSAAFAQMVNLRGSTTTLSASHTDPTNPQEVTLIAVVQGAGAIVPQGTVSFNSGTLVAGTAPVDANGVATHPLPRDAGRSTENIIAQYGGDGVYAGSNSSPTAVAAGSATQFTLTIAPASISVVSAQHATIQLSLSSVAGFSDTIQLGCLGLPFAATCTFSVPQAKLSANGTANAQLTIDTGDPLGMGAQNSARLRDSGRGALLCILPVGALLGVMRRKRRLLYGAVSLSCVMLMIAGCSGLKETSTPPGTYSFKVTGAGAGSGATQSQVVTLTVTQ